MSLPSVHVVAQEMGISRIESASDAQCEQILVAAMRRDLPLAVKYLESKMKNERRQAAWDHNDPNSPLGKQLIRLHASDALRPLAQKHFCRGKKLSFLNCCGDSITEKKPKLKKLIRLQIQMQDGTLARADC